ncbi:MAG TPA: sigma-70 family RNA polymerase sigma factor [Polyangia bacterium]
MQTAGEIGTFQRQSAEVPHQAVAFTLTDSEAQEPAASERPRCVTSAKAEVDSADGLDRLVHKAQAGDRAAFDELLVAIRPRALAAALRVVHNRDDAEDAVQDAFFKVWRCLAAFEGRSSFSTWIHRIVTNSSLDLLRRNTCRSETAERVDGQVLAVTDGEPSHEQTPDSELCGYEIQMLVRTAVAALPAAHRQAVQLREFEDCSYQEMAEIIQCPVGTVMSRLHHARQKLASELRNPLGDSPRESLGDSLYRYVS